MFFRKNPRALKTEALATLIDRSVEITGELAFDKGARVDGRVRGNVTGSMSKNNLLIVGPAAVIEGDVTCHSLVVLGSITGNIAASYIEIRSGARIHGDTRYETIEMHQGAEINGRMFRIEGVRVTETPEVPTITGPGTTNVGIEAA